MADETFTPTKERPVHLSEEAITQLGNAELAEGFGIRIVATMSCSGLNYQLGMDEPTDQDIVVKYEGFDLLLGPETAEKMYGTEVGFIVNKLGVSGFDFVNPNAPKSGCGSCSAGGCGSRSKDNE